MTIQEFYSSEDRWCKGLMINMRGQRCLEGALFHCYGGVPYREFLAVRHKLVQHIRSLTPFGSLVGFNDAISTSFADVVAVVKDAGV